MYARGRIIFRINSNDKNSIYDKVLAFTLSENGSKYKINSILEYSKSLLNTILRGNLAIQLLMSENIHFINIPTGEIKATDFDKISEEVVSELIESGRKASADFFNNEIANVKSRNIRRDISKDIWDTNNIITHSCDDKVSEVLIIDTDTKWAYELFPTLIKWKELNADVTLILKNNNDDYRHGNYRRRLLSEMGVKIVSVDNIPFKGYIFDGNDPERAKAVILNQAIKPEKLYTSKYYYGKEDSDVINILREKFLSYLDKSAVEHITIKFSKIDKAGFFKSLKGVKQYDHDSVSFECRIINIGELIFITKYIRGFKYRQIANIIDIYRSNHLELFHPIKMTLSDNKYTIVTPPVIEQHGDNLYVIEGNTRLTYLWKHGVKEILVTIVKGVMDPLPSAGRFSINDILITDKAVSGEDRYEDFDYQRFRKIEKAIRNPQTCLL